MRLPILIFLFLAFCLPAIPVKALDAVVEDDAVVLTVEEGVRRVRVEAIEPSTGQWHIVAIAHIDGQAGVVKIRIPAGLTLDDLRISTSMSDPLPVSAYSGQRVFKPQSGQDGMGTTWGGYFLDGAVAEGDARSATPTIEESDIWKFHGNLLYFFNNRRGLQIIDLNQPDQPQVLGVLPLAGNGEQMYVLDDKHVLLMMSGYSNGEGALVIDVSDTAAPVIVAEIPTAGGYVDSRLIGDTLYLVGVSYGGNYVEGVWESSYGTVVTAWDLSNPALPYLYARNSFPGAALALQVTEEVLMIPTHAYYRKWVPSPPVTPPPSDPPGPPPEDPPPGNPPSIAADTDQFTDGYWSTERVYDVKVLFLDGPVLESNPVQYPHVAVKTASSVSDKFKLNYRNGVLTTISGQGWGGEGATLENWDLGAWISNYSGGGAADSPALLGSLHLAPGETTFGTRFDGDRVYIVTFLRVDPLWVVDNSDPASPAVFSELEVPGWSTYLEPMGDRLLAIGVEDRHVTVSLFDVADPANTSQLARVKLGDPEHYSWSEAVYDEKAITVLRDDGLILLPFQSWTSGGYTNAMQLVDLLPDTLVKRGALEHDDAARRATTFEDHLVSISNGQLFVADASDRDAPEIVSSIELSWAVDHVLAHKDHLLQLSSAQDSYYYYGVDAPAKSILRVTTQGATDSVLARLEIPGMIGGAALSGNHLHLIVSNRQTRASGDTTIYEQVYRHISIDVSDPLAPALVGQTDLGAVESYGGSRFLPLWLPGATLCWYPQGGYYGALPFMDYMGFAPWGWGNPAVATVDLSMPNSPGLLDFVDLKITSVGETYYSDQTLVTDGQDLYRATQSYQWIDGDYLTAQYLQHIDLQDPSAISLGRWVSMPMSTLLSAESSDETTFLYTLSYNRYQDEQDVWQYETILQAHAFDGAGIFPLHSIKTPWVVACEPGVFLAVGQDGENSQITVVEYDFGSGFSVTSSGVTGVHYDSKYASGGYAILFGASTAAALDLRQPSHPRIAGSVTTGDAWWGMAGAPAVLPDEAIFLPSGYSVFRIDLEPAPVMARAPLSAQAQADAWSPYNGAIALESAAETGATGALSNTIWIFRPVGYQPLLPAAQDLGDATFYSEWYGLYWDTYYPWIYHSEFGWVYPIVQSEGSFWAHLDDLGWVYTAQSGFPWLYAPQFADWVAYATGTGANGGTRWYYSYNNGDWFYGSP